MTARPFAPRVGVRTIDLVHLHDPATRSLWLGPKLIERPSRDTPRHRSWSGRVLYCSSQVTHNDLERLIAPGDIGFGPTQGHITMVRMACGGAGDGYHIVRSDSWGVDTPDPHRTVVDLERLHRLTRESEIVPLRTASATVRNLYLDRFVGGQWSTCLPPRWRGLARASVHGGPAICISGGGGENGRPVVCMDINRAYWRALREPMPMLGPVPGGQGRTGRYVASEGPWSELRTRTGMMEATVRVSGPTGPGALPALPVRDTMAGMGQQWVYPTGTVRGAWTIAHVREAEERGEVEVIEVHQAMVATMTIPLFRPLMDFLGDPSSVHPEVAKLLYARLYGILGAAGGFEVTRPEADGPLHWQSRRIEPMVPGGPPTYRPDLAAMVTGFSHRTLLTALRQLRTADTVACHVDAVWTHDLAGAKRLDPDLWRCKRSGRVWYFGAGVFVHWSDDGTVECGAAGYSDVQMGPPTIGRLRRFAGAALAPELLTRTWLETARDPGDETEWETGRYPWEHSGAMSEPPELAGAPARSIVRHPSVTDGRWSPNGCAFNRGDDT